MEWRAREYSKNSINCFLLIYNIQHGLLYLENIQLYINNLFKKII